MVQAALPTAAAATVSNTEAGCYCCWVLHVHCFRLCIQLCNPYPRNNPCLFPQSNVKFPIKEFKVFNRQRTFPVLFQQSLLCDTSPGNADLDKYHELISVTGLSSEAPLPSVGLASTSETWVCCFFTVSSYLPPHTSF